MCVLCVYPMWRRPCNPIYYTLSSIRSLFVRPFGNPMNHCKAFSKTWLWCSNSPFFCGIKRKRKIFLLLSMSVWCHYTFLQYSRHHLALKLPDDININESINLAVRWSCCLLLKSQPGSWLQSAWLLLCGISCSRSGFLPHQKFDMLGFLKTLLSLLLARSPNWAAAPWRRRADLCSWGVGEGREQRTNSAVGAKKHKPKLTFSSRSSVRPFDAG